MSAAADTFSPRFRPMREADLDAVMEIEVRAYAHPWTRAILSDCLRVGYNCWLYEQEGRIEAYGVMSVAVGEAHILNLTVRPESQGQGLGRKILEHFLGLAGRYSADMVLLEVRPSNTAALALYGKMGFNEIGVRKNYYPGPSGREDALVLALTL